MRGVENEPKIDARRSRVLDCWPRQQEAHMPVSERLLEILACPVCKVKVQLKPDGSGLKCTECKRVYPIRDDIPVMLVDEAVIEE
jgi:uncharacterized protein